MRILMVSGPVISLKEPYNGGTEPFIVELANMLVRKGHSVDVIAREAEERHSFQLIEFDESPYSMKDDVYPEWQGQEYYRVFQYALMNVDRYDVIHYNSFIPEMYDAGSFFDVPSVLTLHLPASEKFKLVYGLFAKRTGTTGVAISRRLHDEWKQVIPGKIPVIHNGIDIDRWKFDNKKDKQYLLWSGRINEEKNPLDAIRIARQLDRPLMIVGKIADQRYFNQRIKPLLGGSVVYAGHTSQDELVAIAQKAAVFLATATWNEPFGLSTLEMLACGVPVVGYESAIPPELRSDGISVAINTADWENLVPYVEQAYLADVAACNAFARTFSLEQMCDKYIDLYESLSRREQI